MMNDQMTKDPAVTRGQATQRKVRIARIFRGEKMETWLMTHCPASMPSWKKHSVSSYNRAALWLRFLIVLSGISPPSPWRLEGLNRDYWTERCKRRASFDCFRVVWLESWKQNQKQFLMWFMSKWFKYPWRLNALSCAPTGSPREEYRWQNTTEEFRFPRDELSHLLKHALILLIASTFIYSVLKALILLADTTTLQHRDHGETPADETKDLQKCQSSCKSYRKPSEQTGIAKMTFAETKV